MFFAIVSFLGALCLVMLRISKIGVILDVGPVANGVVALVESKTEQP